MNAKRMSMVAVLLIAAIAVWGYRIAVFGKAAPGPKPTLAIVTGGSGPYWQLIADGARTAANELGVKVEVKMPEQDEDIESQMTLLNGLDLESVDAIAVSPLDAEAQTHKIDRLAEEAFVVTIDSDAPLSERLSYVGASNLAAGQKCAALVREAIPDGGKVAVLMANLSKDNMQKRKNGFAEALSEEASEDGDSSGAVEVVGYFTDEGNEQRCEEQLRELIAEHDDLACVVGMNAQHGPLLLRVLKDLDELGNIKLVTFDTPDETLEGIEAGHVYGTIAQDPYHYGYEATRLLAFLCQRAAYQLPPPGRRSTLFINTQVVREGNLEEYRRSVEELMRGPATKAGDKSGE